MGREAETRTQRRRQHALPGGCAHHGESGQRQRDGRGAGPLAHHDVDAEILHGDVQQFLRGARKTVDLVDEQHFPCVQRAEYRSQVARVLDCRTGRDANRHLQLVGYDHRQRGLAQSGRAGEQDVVGGGVTFAGGVQEQLQLGLEPRLPDESVKGVRPQFLVADRLVVDCGSGDHA